ncbi:NAD-dependent epimerase/dehydratase family protein [Arthrobacter glacialis]|uniref:NAD-dependent epimerase/dehydratase family protein n=1 Tax=Arthrobacter glacialis TaxID=1664 RepID=UPI000CD3F1FA|nr:NAD-dependent epimerase/dehydratase family protein [Arthrobacter glacialis]POH59871.1 epimerase [Arthrobacter glacialis]
MSSEPTHAHWLVLGASGFVGSAVVAELRGRGLKVATLAAPRLNSVATTAQALADQARLFTSPGRSTSAADYAALLQAFDGVDVVVNAAGLAAPGDAESPSLTGANALLPAVIALAARAAGVKRLVHLSSASVQGHRRVIDETSVRAPFSAYSRSKTLGEEVLEVLAGDTVAAVDPDSTVVTIRATSVQGPSRSTTLSLAKIAASPLASVASPGTAPTPVSSIDSLAWFVVEAGAFAGHVPALVLQPWEGLTVTDVLAAAGGQAPMVIPAWLCRPILASGYFVSGLLGERLHGSLRRVELMWLGQEQTPGWAEEVGLVPPSAIRPLLERVSLTL